MLDRTELDTESHNASVSTEYFQTGLQLRRLSFSFLQSCAHMTIHKTKQKTK